MTINSLGALAVLTIRSPDQAARQLLSLKPGREGLWLAFALFAFVSMFRNPLIYLTRRLRGEFPEIPK